MGKNDDQSVVTIKPLAYYKMLLHVLRFGSKYIEHSKLSEVMGVLIGHLVGDSEIQDVIVEDVVPVSHGGTIEVKFSVEQLGAFGELDSKIWEQYGDLGWFSVGWYHSHPGLGLFFSDTDKFNQIFWQKNPSGIGIVFDHTLLDKPENVGFKIFRLNETNLEDPTVAMKSDYHEVEAVVESPDNTEYYLKIMELIGNVHTGLPQILELNETIDLFSDVVIPQDDQVISKPPEINVDEIISILKNGMEKFLELSTKPLMHFLNSWGQTTVNKISSNNTQMRSDLKELRDGLSNEIINLQRSFNYDLQNDLKDLDFYVDDKLEDLDNEKENITALVQSVREDSIKQLELLFEEEIKVIYDQLQNKINKLSDKISDFNQKFSNQIENQREGYSKLNSLIEGYKSLDN
ncbi:MAG: hypothetical protein ACW99L_17065, partial [Promethearchaeota archaeon]